MSEQFWLPYRWLTWRTGLRMKRVVFRLIPFVFFRLGLIRLWRRLPLHARRRIVDRLTVIPDSSFGPAASSAKPPFIVCGLATSHSSFGWAIRSTLGHLRDLGQSPEIVDVSPYFWSDAKRAARPLGSVLADTKGSGTLILNVNPDQMNYVCSLLPKKWMAGKYRIAYCVWELEVIPHSWHARLAPIQELWVPSTFVRDAFCNSGFDKPIRIIPYKLEIPPSLNSDRAKFGLPADRFIVLVVFHVRSSLARKNPMAAIEAFRRAFGNDETVQLVVKVHYGHFDPEAVSVLRTLITDAVNIRIIEDDLSEPDIWGLIAACDCILSLHRAEGFGLVLKQGLMLNKPTVATGWSGNTDFMSGENAYFVPYRLVSVHDPDAIDRGCIGARWAEADIDAAAKILRKLYRQHVRTRCPSEGKLQAPAIAVNHKNLSGIASSHEDSFGGK